jgi:hypothetical protein
MSAKVFEESKERVEAAHEGGERWVPVAAAVLAVFAAVSGFLSNQRSTQALIAKNDSIVATTRAADAYNEYQAARLKYAVAETALDAGVRPGGDAAKLTAAATHEERKAPAALRKAQEFERQAVQLDDRSERRLRAHETIEMGSTLFEVSIVLVSITALVGSRLLPIAAGIASALGIICLIYGLLQ